MFVFAFTAGYRTIKRVDHHGGGLRALRADIRDQHSVIFHEVSAVGDQIKRRVGDVMPLAEGFNAPVEAGVAFERQIDNFALAHLAPTVRPAERDVHDQVEGPEALAAFHRPPDHSEADPWDQSGDKVGECGL